MIWKRVGVFSLAVAALMLAVGVGYCAWILSDDPVVQDVLANRVGPDIAFDAHAWKAAPLYGNDETRLRMVDDLQRKHRLKGIAKQEVVSLLGPPSDPAYAPERSIVYWLGPERGWIRFDSAWLALEFKNDRVVKIYETAD